MSNTFYVPSHSYIIHRMLPVPHPQRHIMLIDRLLIVHLILMMYDVASQWLLTTSSGHNNLP